MKNFKHKRGPFKRRMIQSKESALNPIAHLGKIQPARQSSAAEMPELDFDMFDAHPVKITYIRTTPEEDRLLVEALGQPIAVLPEVSTISPEERADILRNYSLL